MTTYSHWDVLMASPSNPISEERKRHQLTRMHEGLEALEKSPKPTLDDWQVVADAINMMEMFVEMGVAQDPDDLLEDAMDAMQKAGHRSIGGDKPIRLDGCHITTIRGMLEDYETILSELPERTVIAAHRQAEKRLVKILSGKPGKRDRAVTK